MRSRGREPGQILVLFTGALVLILAVTSLVIDAGFVFLIRRQEQNAADPGAIAAARHIRSGAGFTAEPLRMRQAACQYAQENGFFEAAGGNPDGCIPGNDAHGAILTVHYPPSAAAGPYQGNDGMVEVSITRPHQAFLGGLIGLPVFTVSSNAVASYDVGQSNTNSLVALDDTDTCSTGKIHGGGGVNIYPVTPGTDGGYVQVNSTCGFVPDPPGPDDLCSVSGQGGLDIVGTGSLTTPHAFVNGACKKSGDLNGPLLEGAVQIGDPMEDLTEPDLGTPNPGAECGTGSGIFTTPTGSGASGCRFNSAGTYDLQPGVYYGGWDIRNNVTLVLAPGIYVIAGGGVGLNAGGSITSVQGGGGAPAPVLLFNTDNPVTCMGQADIDFSAQGTLKLRGMDSGPYKGLLLWNDGSDDPPCPASNPDAEVSLGGQVSLDISGTIYNPKGNVKVEGGSGVGSVAAIQIIAWQFDVGGNSLLDMPYDPNLLYQFPSLGLVR